MSRSQEISNSSYTAKSRIYILHLDYIFYRYSIQDKNLNLHRDCNLVPPDLHITELAYTCLQNPLNSVDTIFHLCNPKV